MRVIAPVLLASLFALGPAPARAVTVDEIVSMTKSGVSEQVLLAVIERDKTIFALDGDQLIALQRQGVSEAVILAMLRSGRAPESEAAVPPAAFAAVPAPDLVIVGHGPDRPNTATAEPLFFVPIPAFVQVLVGGMGERPRRARAAPIFDGSFGGRRFASDPTSRFMNGTFVPRDLPDGMGADADGNLVLTPAPPKKPPRPR